MDDMSSGDWFEDGSLEDAVAHFDALPTHETSGPLPGNGRVVVASVLTFAGGTTIRPEVQRPLGRIVGAVPTRA